MKITELTKTLNPPSISVGDEVKVGKWKNRKAEVKGFTKDDHGQPVLKTTKGDQKLYKPRVTKLEPKEVDESGSRRASDRVSADHAFEMIATLAMEYALKNDRINSAAVELAIEKCRGRA